MPKFAANLTLLFTEKDELERAAAAARAGFDGVEMLFPYGQPAKAWQNPLGDAGMPLVLFNTPAPDWSEGGRGCAAIAGQESRFRAEFEQALQYGDALKPAFIHIMSGITDSLDAIATLTRNLEWAARQAPAQALTIEPINPFDMPGYALHDFDTALHVLADVDAPNLHLQFDAYHAHRITGDVAACWAKVKDRAAHVQVAGFPGRHEPIGGDIDYPAFFAQLDGENYAGWISGEYFPRTKTEQRLDWIA